MFTGEEFPNADYYRSDLRKILNTLKKLEPMVEELTAWQVTHEEEYKELKHLIDEFNAGHFTEPFITNLKEWIVNNVNDLISFAIKNVWFGLTDTGYFVAYIPDSWEDIIFNTAGYDIAIEDVDYGRLILSY